MNEERKDTSKQVLLSVLGVAILIVAVVGISFAAFTYTRAGQRENVVTTGKIVMDYTETTRGINISNAIPMTESQALAAYTGDVASGEGQNYNTAADANNANTSASDNVFDFTVSADISGNTRIDYDITAQKAINHADDTDCDYTATPSSNAYASTGSVSEGVATVTTGAYTDGKRINGSGSDADKIEAAGYAKCEYVSDADIRIWIGEASNKRVNKYVGDSNYSAASLTDSDYHAIDLNSGSADDSSAWTPLNSARATGAPSAEMLLVEGNFTTSQTRYYRLKMWVANDYALDGVARSYKVKVNVYSKDHDTANLGGSN